MIHGVDVSNYQTASYAITGCDFVVVKATEGTSYVNPKHAEQVQRGRDHGLVVGHYHFAQGTNIHAQVDYFLAQAKPKAGDFLALDWENSAMSSAEKDDFLAYLDSKTACRVLLYCNVDYWRNHDSSQHVADGLWIAEYGIAPGKPNITHSWLLHQYTSTPIDTSVANFATRASMAAWANPTVPAKPNALPPVSLAHAVAAFQRDPKATQGHTTHPGEVKLIEHALVKVGMMHSSKYTEDGSAETLSVTGYSDWQKHWSKIHNLGWKGAEVNGIPGMTSLKALGDTSKLFKAAK